MLEKANTNNNYYFEMTGIMIFAEPMYEKLLHKGFSEYLLNDYKCRFEFRPHEFNDVNTAEKQLMPVLIDILGYLRLPPVVSLTVVLDNQKEADHVGRYHSEWHRRNITLNISKEYSINNILSILCHECTHYFMEYNKLNWMSVELNERRTDMIACLIGFSSILADGYKEKRYTGTINSQRTVISTKIGYLSSEECLDLNKYVVYRRAELSRIMAEENAKENSIQELNRLIELMKMFSIELERIDPISHAEPYKYVSPDYLPFFQQAIFDYQSINIETQVLKYQEAASLDRKPEIVAEELESAKRFCAKLQMIMNTFVKASSRDELV